MTLILLALAALAAALFFLTSAFAESRLEHRTIGTGIVKFKGKGPEAWYQRYRAERRLHRGTAAKAQRARQALRSTIATTPYGTHWLERAFLCIHGGEGAWSSNTGNGYYGGMQMDTSFQRAYGPEYVRAFGTADKWPVSVQLAVSIKAYLSGRGFYPWPNTARFCGLLP